MANQMYPKGRQAFLEGSVAYLTDTIKCALVKSAYTYSSAHQFLSDLGANVVSAAQALGTKTSTSGKASAANITFPSVGSGNTVGYLALYKDTGVAGTSALIGLIDTASINGGSVGLINVATNGGDITVTWDAVNGIFTL